MNIGELFVSLDIKDTDKAVKAASEVKNSLADVTTSGLAAKAGILGMVYALERLTDGSNRTGMSLMNYAAATGLSIKNLQEWQFAASRAGVSGEEMKNTFVNLQKSMLTMAQGGGVPSGWGILSQRGHIDQSRIRDTEYVMKKLMDVARTSKDFDFINDKLQSMGISMDMIAAARQGVFNDKNFRAAHQFSYSEGQAKQLQAIGVAWSDLYRQWEKGVGTLNAKHGLSIINDLKQISTELLRMVDLFAQLTEKLEILKLVGKAFEGWSLILKSINGDLSGLNSEMSEAKPIDNKGTSFSPGVWWDRLTKPKSGIDTGDLTSTSRGAIVPHGPTNNVVNMTNHIQGVKDLKDAAHHIKKEFNRAGQRINQKGQVN